MQLSPQLEAVLILQPGLPSNSLRQLHEQEVEQPRDLLSIHPIGTGNLEVASIAVVEIDLITDAVECFSVDLSLVAPHCPEDPRRSFPGPVAFQVVLDRQAPVLEVPNADAIRDFAHRALLGRDQVLSSTSSTECLVWTCRWRRRRGIGNPDDVTFNHNQFLIQCLNNLFGLDL